MSAERIFVIQDPPFLMFIKGLEIIPLIIAVFIMSIPLLMVFRIKLSKPETKRDLLNLLFLKSLWIALIGSFLLKNIMFLHPYFFTVILFSVSFTLSILVIFYNKNLIYLNIVLLMIYAFFLALADFEGAVSNRETFEIMFKDKEVLLMEENDTDKFYIAKTSTKTLIYDECAGKVIPYDSNDLIFPSKINLKR
ncbi:hypothetical protein [Marivirga atlantica]|uniref:Uncharacterized protein n=1 Tax=Marivirga atlantica TaxID=1548457 RepID=A0A937A7Q8_9BACT|nr:hypothetical protein [Marivirga atlantica]